MDVTFNSQLTGPIALQASDTGSAPAGATATGWRNTLLRLVRPSVSIDAPVVGSIACAPGGTPQGNYGPLVLLGLGLLALGAGAVAGKAVPAWALVTGGGLALGGAAVAASQ